MRFSPGLLTHLVKDVKVPLIGWLAGYPGLLQQICLHRCPNQQLTPLWKNDTSHKQLWKVSLHHLTNATSHNEERKAAGTR